MRTLSIIIIAIFGLSACSTRKPKEEQVTSEVLSTDSPSVMTIGTINPIPPPEKKNTLSDIQVGMSDEKVRALLGKPTKVDVLVSELGARMEDWWYGKNQKVRITGGQVTHVVKDVAKEQETLTKVKEARERGDDAEGKRLMEEMSASN